MNKYIFLPRFHIESLFWIYLSKPMLIHLGMQALQMKNTDISGFAGIRLSLNTRFLVLAHTNIFLLYIVIYR